MSEIAKKTNIQTQNPGCSKGEAEKIYDLRWSGQKWDLASLLVFVCTRVFLLHIAITEGKHTAFKPFD